MPTSPELSYVGAYNALGDSITAGNGSTPFPTYLGQNDVGLTVNNLGSGGYTAENVESVEIPEMISPCTLVTIDAGTNDALHYISAGTETLAQFESAFQQILSSVAASCPNATVAVITLIDNQPSGSATDIAYGEINGYLRSLSGFVLVDANADIRLHTSQYTNDDIHPNAAGEILLAQDVDEVLAGNAGFPSAQLLRGSRDF